MVITTEMKKIMNISNLPFFSGLTDNEIKEIFKHKNAVFERHFKSGEHIYSMGQSVNNMGIVVSGSVNIESIDFWENKSILSNVKEGEAFAETYALCDEPISVNAVAVSGCDIIFVALKELLSEKNSGFSWHTKLLSNMLKISITKNLTLSSRIFCTGAKNIRGRVLTYLSKQALKADSTKFKIPFNRQQLADYLNVDRSALSKELSKMRDEGIIDFNKNSFEIYNV